MKKISVPVIYFVLVIITAHFFSPPGYQWTEHTISELAAQNHPYQWIMKAGFMGFGFLLFASILHTAISLKKLYFSHALLLIYGAAIFFSGIFSTAHIDTSLSYSVDEAQLHSTMATTAGIVFTLAILVSLIRSFNSKEAIFHTAFLAGVAGLSFLFGFAKDASIEVGPGLAQRLLYFLGFAWLILQEGISEKKGRYT